MLNGILKVEKYGDKFVLTNPDYSKFLLNRFMPAESLKLATNVCRPCFV
jgi:hypothetical protein